MHIRYFFAICILGASSQVSAQDMYDTRDAELVSANIDLNATYGRLIKQLGRDEQAQLRTAQRAWITFRDLDCKFGWAERRDCMIIRTTEREKQLRDSNYFTPKGDLINLPAPPY